MPAVNPTNPMNENSNAAMAAIRESAVNLLDLVERATRELNGTELAIQRQEAQGTLLMLVSAIARTDNRHDAGERAFAGLLADWGRKTGGEPHDVDAHAGRWNTACRQVPQFFRTGADHDLRHKTQLASAMLQEIRLIGNNTAVSDGTFEPSEHPLLRDYCALLERYLATTRALPAALVTTAAPGWCCV